MRMAGFFRREKGREQTLEYWSESRYSYEEFISGIKKYFAAKGIPFPEDISDARWRIYKRGRRDGNLDLSILTKPESELYPRYARMGVGCGVWGVDSLPPTPYPLPPVSTTYTGSIPLHLALSKGNQFFLKGVESERNTIGFAVASDLIGCDERLRRDGYSVEGDPL